jgi:predicted nucleic acid-binding protein
MTQVYVDATTAIALGTIGELDLLSVIDGQLVILPPIQREVTTEPVSTNVDRLLDTETVEATPSVELETDQARALLGSSELTGDVALVGAVLAHTAADHGVAVISDDRRVRTTARGLGATVTGTVGILVRAVEKGLSAEEAKAILDRLDDHGLHMTAELRATAGDLIAAAASDV